MQPATQRASTAQAATANAPEGALLDKILAEYKPFMEDEPIRLTVRTVLDLLCAPTKSGKLCSERDAKRFIGMCKARKLNPFAGDAYIVGYDGKDGPQFSLITAHQAFLKRAEVHPEYDGMESGVIVRPVGGGEVIDRQGDFTFDGEELLGAWATVHFKTRKYPAHRRLKLQTYDKGFSRWNADKAGMIVKCAEADALRSSFPTMLGGLYLDDEFSPMPAALSSARAEQKLNGTVAKVPTAAAPPGRKPGAAATCTPPAALAEGELPAEASPPLAEDLDTMDKAAMVETFAARLRGATDTADLEEVGADLLQNREWLGEDPHAAILAEYQRRYRELSTKRPRRTAESI